MSAPSAVDPVARPGGGPDADPRRSARTLRRWGLVLAALVLLATSSLVLAPSAGGPPLDPDSPGPDGLLGVVELLGEVGVEVDVSTELPDDKSTNVFVPVDALGAEQYEAWRGWVEDGGTLVVADPDSALHEVEPVGQAGAASFGATERSARCDLLAEVGEVRHGDWTGLRLEDGDVGCFPSEADGAAWLVQRPVGDGAIVALGSAEPLTNDRLDEADNAVLAAALLGPAPGERLRIVPRPAPGEAPTGPLALVAPSVWWGLSLLGLAAATAALWRGRRLGPPVAEALPPVVPSAELARSVAGLLQRTGDHQAAAQRLRRAIRREVEHHLGAVRGDDHAGLVELLVARSGVARADAERALLSSEITDDAALVAVAEACRRVRSQLRRPPGG